MWREASPRGALADLKTVYRQAGKHRFSIGVLAALTTFTIFSLIASEVWTKPRPKPEIIYINSWPEDRTAAESKEFIAENQRRKDERAKLEAEVEAETKELWKALGRASGMDVEAIEARAEAERAEAERKAAEAAKAKAPVAQ